MTSSSFRRPTFLITCAAWLLASASWAQGPDGSAREGQQAATPSKAAVSFPFDLGDIPAGESVEVSFQVTVANPVAAGADTISNQGTVSATGVAPFSTDDPDTGAADDATVINLGAAPDLTLTKSDGDVSVLPGGVIAYTLSYANVGNQGATGVILMEEVPADTTFDAAGSTAGWTCADGAPAGTMCELAIGAVAGGGGSGMATFAVQVDDPYMGPISMGVGTISNTAEVIDDEANGTDPNPGNNVAMDDTPVVLDADLTVSKSVDVIEPLVGEQVTFTVTVTNNGPAPATGVTVGDVLPSGLTPVSDNPSQGSYDGTTWTVTDMMSGPLGVGAMATLEIVATVAPGAMDPAGTGAFIDVFASGGGLVGPLFAVFGADENLYVTSTETDQVLRYDGTTGAFVDVFASGGGLDDPNGLVFGPDGNLYVASNDSDQILRYDGTTGAFIDVFAVGIDEPVALTFEAGDLFATAGGFDNDVRRFDGETGASLGVFASGNGLQAPTGLTFGPDGNLYVANSSTSEVLRFDGASGAFIDAFVSGALGFDLTFGPEGSLFLTDPANNEVQRFDGTSGTLRETFVDDPALGFATGLVFGPDGNLYVSSIDGDEVRRYDGFVTNKAHIETSDQPDPDLTNNWASSGIDWQSADYGDAPDPLVATAGEYPTLLANDGARHIVPKAGATLFLGAAIDSDDDGQPNADATGDDTDGDGDDEDGVTVSELALGLPGTVTVTASAAGVVNAWIDFDGDGVFENGAPEQIATNLAVVAGANPIMVTVPMTAASSTFARVRISTAGGDAATGLAVDGEVEDHAVTILPEPMLTLTKDDEGITAMPGGTIVYTLSYANAMSVGTATGVMLNETVPVGTTFDAAGSTAGWTCADNAPAGSMCTLAVADVPAGGGASADFAVTVDNPLAAGITQIDNTATIDANGAMQMMAMDTTPVDAAPDLVIGKDDGGVVVLPGDTLAYTLTYSNDGDQDATGVEITETVPTGTTFNAGASTAGWSCADGSPGGTMCVLTVGALAGGGAGGMATFAVDLLDPLPMGLLELTNTVSIADDGSNGADPNPGDNTDTVITSLDVDPPTVEEVSINGTPLEDCDEIRGESITAIEVDFDDMSSILGADDASNYVLVGVGATDDFQSTCGAVDAVNDDVVALMAAHSGDPADNAVLTLDVPPLADGQYRLLVCDTITDQFANALDGDGDGNAGGDLEIDFRVDRFNLFENGHFDDCDEPDEVVTLAPWITMAVAPNTVAASVEDVVGSVLSGSAEVDNATTEISSLMQCVPASPTGGNELRSQYRFDAVTDASATYLQTCEYFASADCTGSPLTSITGSTFVEDTAGAWEALTTEAPAPAGTQSALCTFAVQAADAGDAGFQLYLDELFLGNPNAIFEDGFETGDTSRWTFQVP